MEKDEKMEKLVQVRIFVDRYKELNADINEFLLSNRLTRDDLIDIKFTTNMDHRMAMVIYEVNMEKK